MLEDGNGRWVGCGFYFFKTLILDGGEGRGLYFFIFKLLMFVNFWGFLLLKGGGKVGCEAFILKKIFFCC